MENIEAIKKDYDEINDVLEIGLNFDKIQKQSVINSSRILHMITSAFVSMQLSKTQKSIELETIKTNYGQSSLEAIAETIDLDLNNDIRTAVKINGREIQPIFFSVSSLFELGDLFNLDFYSFNDSEKIIINNQKAKEPVLIKK